MDGDLDNALFQLQKRIDKQNELQERGNDLMSSLVSALQGLAQEIADWREDMPEAQAAKEKRSRAAKAAAVGKYAPGKAPRR